MIDENEKIAIEVLQDFLKADFSFENSFEHIVKAQIQSAKEELKYLTSTENKIFTQRVQIKIKELEENINLNKFKSFFYPHQLYSKDLKTKINFLNENYRYECQLCKKDNLVLIPSGKVWFCGNRSCKGKQFLNKHEMEFLKITYDYKKNNKL